MNNNILVLLCDGKFSFILNQIVHLMHRKLHMKAHTLTHRKIGHDQNVFVENLGLTECCSEIWDFF